MNFVNNVTGNSLGKVTEFTGQFTGTGGLYINGFSSSAVVLSGDNSGWSGVWDFQGSTRLQLNHVNALGTSTTINFDNQSQANASRGELDALVALTGANALPQDISLGVNSYSNNTATIRTTANLELTGVISGNATTRLVKEGSAKLYLGGTNTYAGGTLVSAGILIADSDAAFGSGDVEFDGGQWNNGAGTVIPNNMILTKTVNGNALSGPTDFTGQLSGSGDLRINGFASGVVTLSGDNSGWSGNWEFTGRNTLQLNHVNALGSGTKITFDDSPFDDHNRGELESLVDLTGANAVTQNVSLGTAVASNNTSTIRTTADMELAGVVSGESTTPLLKVGTASLILSSANTYAGGTILHAGTLVAAADSALGSNDVSVSSGAVLVLTNGVSNDYIADAANLVLDGNANLNLAFSGTADAIGSLSLDGGTTTVPDGIYTASALSGLGTGTYTGAGSLVVGAGVTEIGNVDSVILPGGTSLSLSWTAESGASYAVQTNADLVDGVWGDFQTGISGSGAVLITNDLIGPVGFYRIVVE
jgi:autotransporter-associated beta strand protein